MSWTPTEAQGRSTNRVTVTVTDDGDPPLGATIGFTLVVNEVNLAPRLALPPSAAVDEQTPLRAAQIGRAHV